MTPVTNRRLPCPRRAGIIQVRVKYATFMVLSLLAHAALAQQPPVAPAAKGGDDLDVTMQIIMDPDAKLPDEVVRRIPLPERKPAPSAPANAESESAGRPDQADRNDAREAKELGREVGQSARDSAKEAREQREEARRAAAEERRRRNEDNNPNRPPNPPGRPPRD